jgi:NAD(P)-dependent dehydrogenase (short-subunit alcohol dehydrogenase family)
MQLKDKVAVITGGASGIGKATCLLLARERVKVIAVVDMDEHTETACEEINAEAGRNVVVAFRGDAVDPEFRERVFRTMEERSGPVSLCVPAAGITLDRLCVKVNQSNGTVVPDIYCEEDFRRVIDVDLIAPIYWALRTVASVAMDRVRRGLGPWAPDESVQGAIVMIGSVSSVGNRGQISYATAKAGLEGAQSTLAKEAIYYGVRCAIIHPGFTDTPMVRKMGEGMIRDHVLPNTQLRRLIRPNEIASAIVFMLQNSAVSGSLWADAGWHPRA